MAGAALFSFANAAFVGAKTVYGPLADERLHEARLLDERDERREALVAGGDADDRLRRRGTLGRRGGRGRAQQPGSEHCRERVERFVCARATSWSVINLDKGCTTAPAGWINTTDRSGGRRRISSVSAVAFPAIVRERGRSRRRRGARPPDRRRRHGSAAATSTTGSGRSSSVSPTGLSATGSWRRTASRRSSSRCGGTPARYDSSRALVTTWLFTIVRNKAVDAVRWQSRRGAEPLPEDWSFGESPDSADIAAAAENGERVAAALAELPTPQLEVLSLTYFEGSDATPRSPSASTYRSERSRDAFASPWNDYARSHPSTRSRRRPGNERRRPRPARGRGARCPLAPRRSGTSPSWSRRTAAPRRSSSGTARR